MRAMLNFFTTVLHDRAPSAPPGASSSCDRVTNKLPGRRDDWSARYGAFRQFDTELNIHLLPMTAGSTVRVKGVALLPLGGSGARAKTLCAICPVRQPCLDYTLADPERRAYGLRRPSRNANDDEAVIAATIVGGIPTIRAMGHSPQIPQHNRRWSPIANGCQRYLSWSNRSVNNTQRLSPMREQFRFNN